MPIPAVEQNGRPFKWRLVLIYTCLLAVIGTGAWLSLGLAPVRFGAAKTVTFEIPRGAGIANIGHMLAGCGLLRDPFVFRLWAKISGNDRKVKAGTYMLAPGMSVPKIISVLTTGRELTIRVTIPEGSSLKETAVILEQHGIVTKDTFLQRAADPALIGQTAPDAGGASLEGFLFPDTYFLSNAAGADGAIKTMTARLAEVFTPAMRRRAQIMKRSVREIIIMASIVEREAKRAADRPKIAAVFYNRLRTGIALQSCATVQYALGKHQDRLLYADLQVASPYNTYLYRGLPPGPISSPGQASIRAALYPDPDNYLYFVAKPDGSHVFSRTYQEHLRAQRLISRGR